MRNIVFISLLLSFGVSAGWKQVFKVNKKTEKRDEIISLISYWDSEVEKHFRAISLGELERPIIISYELKISDIVWKNEPSCFFELNEKRPIVKNYEYSTMLYKFSSKDNVYGVSVGEADEWGNWGNPCEHKDYLKYSKLIKEI
ncbi:MAG: hypothetical protein DRQ88_00770 [Epsilonproteobacteria bacterium]|nr:MAG: hypothetical protein DRQ89_10305 [Campylobacterota bacterium]RLA68167.1 MAG: hypothetical protein DRQ88_00770 [Campylobacterota bacterium]